MKPPILTPRNTTPANWQPDTCTVQEMLNVPAEVDNDCGYDIGAPTVEMVNKQIFMDYTPSRIQTTYGPRLMDVYNYGYDIGLCDYPIYDEAFRPVLNKLISDHFYLREIGSETIPQFVFYLNRTMREIMPIFNMIFAKLADPNFDPFAVDMNTQQKAKAHNTSEFHSATSADQVSSNAPQVNLSPNGEKPRARDGYWNSGAFSDTTDNNNSIADSLSGYVMNVHGHNTLGYEMIQAYLTSYLNPLNALFAELEPCFTQLFTDHVNGL